MAGVSSNTCGTCAHLLRDNQELRARVKQLEQEKRELAEQLAEARKDSSTSAKPPSSDIVKPPKPTLGGRPRVTSSILRTTPLALGPLPKAEVSRGWDR